jgi:two-component system cell cycle response regulator DivK
VARTALIVDDDPPTLRLYRLLLEQAGMNVMAANNGLEAIRLAVEYGPDLIITDVRLPLVSGLEVVRQIRRHPLLRRTAAVVITAVATPENEQLSLDAGCDAYLVKPVPVLTFLAAVRRCLAQEELRRKQA